MSIGKNLMENFKITGENIHLNQLLKLLGWVSNGGEANVAIEQGLVRVNGQVELRKRNKIVPGFKVEFEGKEIVVE